MCRNVQCLQVGPATAGGTTANVSSSERAEFLRGEPYSQELFARWLLGTKFACAHNPAQYLERMRGLAYYRHSVLIVAAFLLLCRESEQDGNPGALMCLLDSS